MLAVAVIFELPVVLLALARAGDLRDAEPLVVEIRSGLAGRKRHLAVLCGAPVMAPS